MKKMTYIWQDRKRTFLGLPLSFTKYMLNEERIFVEKGFFNAVLDEENLYRVRDVRVSRSLGQRIFGLGTVTVFATNGETVLESIKNPIEVKEEIVRLMEEARKKYGIRASEMLMSEPDMVCEHDIDLDLDQEELPEPPAGE